MLVVFTRNTVYDVSMQCDQMRLSDMSNLTATSSERNERRRAAWRRGTGTVGLAGPTNMHRLMYAYYAYIYMIYIQL